MSKLRISDELSLPLDAITSTIVVYGGKGMGKTNLASVLVEEFAEADLRFCVIDPMGVWWGLRHDADGKGIGIKTLILGGIHGDLPIESTSGAIVADLVVDEDASVVIDISRRADGSMWSISERIRFVTAFTKRVYQRQGEKRRPINLVIDEAARFAPQIVRQGESEVAACMGAVAVIVEEGRNVGIGATLVTQRSARLNKDVAELADCMIAFRIVGPNSMRAVLDWLGEHVEKARLKELSEQLRSLPRGSALVISPGWLEFEGVVAMRKRHTFDSSATPKAGKEVRASGPGAKLDLAKYRERLAEMIERAKADDPKALRARIAELEKQLKGKAPRAEVKTVEKSILGAKDIERLEKVIDGFDGKWVAVEKMLHEVRNQAIDLRAKLQAFKTAPITTRAVGSATRIQAPVTGVHRASEPRHADRKVNGTKPPAFRAHADTAASIVTPLPIGEQAVLRALIQFPDGLRREQLTVLTGYARSSRDAYISRLTSKGLVITNLMYVIATDAGRAAMPDAEPLPTGEALRDYWLRELPQGERAVLEQLIAAYPSAVEKPQIDEATGYQRSSRDAYLSRLGAKQLVTDAGRGMVKASDSLFEISR